MTKFTKQMVEALTESDVATAKARAAANRVTREGLSTIDYILSSVGSRNLRTGKVSTLADAKAYLLTQARREG